LLSITSDDAVKIILCVAIEPESDCGEFIYAYVDKQGNSHWLTETADTSEKLLDLLIELRNFFADDIKSQKNHSGIAAK